MQIINSIIALIKIPGTATETVSVKGAREYLALNELKTELDELKPELDVMTVCESSSSQLSSSQTFPMDSSRSSSVNAGELLTHSSIIAISLFLLISLI